LWHKLQNPKLKIATDSSTKLIWIITSRYMSNKFIKKTRRKITKQHQKERTG
jgi:hypothetical protein